nr:hypothetical protein [Cellvibrionaceae bacterium]
IYNSFHGEYVRLDGSLVKGAGISDYLIAQGEIELENQLRAALEDTMIKVTVIDQQAKAGEPFDIQVQKGIATPSVKQAIDALSAQTDVIEDVIQALNLTTDDIRQDTEEEI